MDEKSPRIARAFKRGEKLILRLGSYGGVSP